MDDEIKQKVSDIVGEKNFTDQLIDLVSYSYDASDHDHRPEAAVWPTSAEQVSKILTWPTSTVFLSSPEAQAPAWLVRSYRFAAASYWTCAE